MKTQIFLQARMGSTRVPGKVMLKICGKSIIELITERLKKIGGIDKIILVSSVNKENEALAAEAKKLGLDFFQGSEENVLDRFYQASLKFRPDVIIRVTGDCPLVDSDLISEGLKIFQKDSCDILSNARIRSFPDGMDYEIFTRQVLERAWKEQKKNLSSEDEFDKTFFNPTKSILACANIIKKDIISEKDLSHIRLTLDYSEDFEVIRKIYENLYKGKYFGKEEILDYLDTHPEISEINKKHICLNY